MIDRRHVTPDARIVTGQEQQTESLPYGLPLERPLTGLLQASIGTAGERGYPTVLNAHVVINLPSQYLSLFEAVGLDRYHFHRNMPSLSRPQSEVVTPVIGPEVELTLQSAAIRATSERSPVIRIGHYVDVLLDPDDQASLEDIKFTRRFAEPSDAQITNTV